jgi:hypothetical protein
VGDQKSASIAVCASKGANIGTGAIAVTAKIAMQTMMTVRERITSNATAFLGTACSVLGCRFRTWNQNVEPERGTRTWNQKLEPERGTWNQVRRLLLPVRYSFQQITGRTL